MAPAAERAAFWPLHIAAGAEEPKDGGLPPRVRGEVGEPRGLSRLPEEGLRRALHGNSMAHAATRLDSMRPLAGLEGAR